MDLLIIRHAEPGDVASVRDDSDPAVTDSGMVQACKTVAWMLRNLRLRRFVGYTSPSLAALQTASALNSVLRIPMSVDTRLGDLSATPSTFKDRSTLFDNLTWDPKTWSGDQQVAPESVADLVGRCGDVLNSTASMDRPAVLMVTHDLPGRVIADLATGGATGLVQTYVRKRLDDVGSQFPVVSHMSGPWPHCGLTLIHDGLTVVRAKAVHNR